jgi:putative ABC transport system permease protein
VVLLTLGLAIGANTAIFSLVRGILLRPLPFAEPDRLVALWSTGRDRGRDPFAIPDYLDIQERTHALCAVGATGNWSANITTDGEPERRPALWSTPGTFALLGVRPILGRTPLAEEERGGGPRVVLLGHSLWRRRFGGDAAVLGRKIVLNGEPFTVVGVLPPDCIPGGREADLIAPIFIDQDNRRENRAAGFLRGLGRLAPGVTRSQAQAELDRIGRALAQEHPDTNAARPGISVTPLHDEVVGRVRAMVLVLQGAVGLVLAIACANLAHLTLARASTRGHELAIRSALGAERGRLARLLVGETLALAFAGGVLGLLLGRAGLALLLALGPQDLPRRDQLGIDGPIALFAAGLALLAGLLSGLAPVLRFAGSEPQEALQGGGRAVTRHAGGGARRALVALEVGLSLVLLTGAGLLLRSFRRLEAVDPGFDPARLLTVRLSLPRARYGDPAALAAFFDWLAPRIRELPGARAAAAASVVPFMEWRASVEFAVEGRPGARAEERPSALYRMVSPGFLQALGVPLRRGRHFSDHDRAGAAPVAVVNETLARRFFADGDPVGAFLTIDDGGLPARKVEIVGVAGDVKHHGLDGPPTYDVYVPMAQIPPGVAIWLANNMSFVVRTAGEPMALADALRREVHAVDPEVPASGVRTMEDLMRGSLGARRLNLVLVEGFGLAALLLAAIGTYAVTAQAVAQRTQEMGVRVALGARRGQIMALVFGQGLRPVGVGLGLGLAASLAVLRLASSLFFGVSAHDPATLLAVVVLLTAVALAAIYAPARRATRVDPVIALRSE